MTGSSPPARGVLSDGPETLSDPKDDLGLVRITPTCAGRASSGLRPGSACRDHPRVCGEHGSARYTPGVTLGSPPLVRGVLIGPWHQPDAERTTPACAGEHGLCVLNPTGQFGSPPCVYGEDGDYTYSLTVQAGLPPRVREDPSDGQM